MYKVVIIDDEEIIVRGLTQMLPWSKWDCEVAGSADNGIEGLALIERVHPSIVITDICMPQMDGLTMIAALKEKYPKMRIMILTGYSEFEYARQALHLGVNRLLVKPSKMDELVEAMESMTADLRRMGIGPDDEQPFVDDSHEENETDDAAAEGAGSSEDEAEGAAKSFIVRRAVEYMRENYDSHLRLEDVADRVYVSQWHLSKLLNRSLGKNFSEIMNEIRVDKAKELLRNPEFRIGDIAEKVGFLDMAHFSRVFKKLTGRSPSDFRNERQN